MEFIKGCAMLLVSFFLMIVGYTMIGAIIGWVVGWFFSEPILNFFAALGIENMSMWDLGAVLGFVGSFFKSNVTNYFPEEKF